MTQLVSIFMTKRKIKIVKRGAVSREHAALPTPQTHPDKGLSETVKDWISERRENKRSEIAASDAAVNDWRSSDRF
jgi:hypothetical protein